MSTETSGEPPARPLLRIVRGEPTAEELAALVAVLSSRGGAGEPEPEPVRSAWSRPGGALHGAPPVHPTAWRESGFDPGVRTRADW